jgi:hypothetical protein
MSDQILEDLEITKKEEKIEKWPWISDFLKGKHSELNFTEMQIDEVTKRALARFSEISKESNETYSEEIRKKWEKQVEDENLAEIIADVAKRPYWQENEKTVQGIVSNFNNSQTNSSENKIEQNELQKDESIEKVEVAENITVENISEVKNLENKENSTSIDEKVVEQKSVIEDSVLIAPVNQNDKVYEVNSSEIKADESKKEEAMVNNIESPILISNKLNKSEIESLANRFKSYGIFSGSLNNKVKKLAEEANFNFESKNEVVSKTNDDGSINITFNGDCKKRHYVDVSNNCYLAVDYDNKSGALNIIKDYVFYDNGDNQYSIVNLKAGNKDLKTLLGSEREAKRVNEKIKGLNLVVCSNPNHLEGVSDEDQPKRQVAAMVDGKTQGTKLTFAQKLSVAAGLLVVGVAAALTGVGIVFGGAALLAAGGVAVSAVAGAATTASSAVAGVATNAVASVISGTATASAGTVVNVAKEVGSFAASTAKTVASGAVDLTNNAVSQTSDITTNDIKSRFDQIREAIYNTAKVASTMLGSNVTQSADKVASVAGNVAGKSENVFSNGIDNAGKIANDVANKSESVAGDAVSKVKDIATSKYIIKKEGATR